MTGLERGWKQKILIPPESKLNILPAAMTFHHILAFYIPYQHPPIAVMFSVHYYSNSLTSSKSSSFGTTPPLAALALAAGPLVLAVFSPGTSSSALSPSPSSSTSSSPTGTASSSDSSSSSSSSSSLGTTSGASLLEAGAVLRFLAAGGASLRHWDQIMRF